MRKTLLLFTALLLAIVGYSQSPPGINYQGVARDLNGKPLVLKDITLRINIVKNSANGEVEYAETHSLKTNSFGLFTLVIGTGDAVTGDFRFVSWAVGDKWLRVEMDPDGGSSFQLMGAQQFMSVPYAFYAKYSGNSLTPGQGISITNNVITNTGDADSNAANELNTGLTLGSDMKLRLTDAGGTLEADLGGLTVSQALNGVLSLGNNAAGQVISGLGDPVAAKDAATKEYVDNKVAGIVDTDTDDQQLFFSGTTLSISDGNSVDLSSLAVDTNTDAQNLTLTGTTLSIERGNSVDLSTLATDNDHQTLAYSGTTLSISGGNSVNLAPLSQDLSLNTGTNTLTLTGDPTPVNLSPYLDNTDDQQLTLVSNTLALTNDATPVDLSPYLDNTDEQTLSLTGTNLAILNGNSVDLSTFMDNTDNQDLSLTGNSLSLTGDPTPVNLAPYLDNTDNQNLGVTSAGLDRIITITGGTGVTINVADNDNSQTNEIQSLAYNTGTKSLSISMGNAVTIPETQNIAQVLTQGNDAGGQRITNIGVPTASADAATKQYVDAGDAAINARISANYAFKTGFSYSNLLSIGNDIAIPLGGESFDDSGVVGPANFTALTSGIYVFVVDGTINSLLGSTTISLLVNGTKHPVTIGGNNRYNSTFMFQVAAGQTVSLVGDGLGIGASISGSFFGYKLL